MTGKLPLAAWYLLRAKAETEQRDAELLLDPQLGRWGKNYYSLARSDAGFMIKTTTCLLMSRKSRMT